MARQMHSQYNYSYDTVKVLLGGWNTWKEKNASDPKAYPIETGASTPAASGAGNPTPAGGSQPVAPTAQVAIPPVNTPAGGNAGAPPPNLVTLPTTAP